VILIDQIETEIANGQHPWNPVIVATQHRLRPILLTAAAAILGPQRQGALPDDLRLALGGVLHRDDRPLRASHQVHRPAHSGQHLAGDHPIGRSSLGVDLKAAQHRHIPPGRTGAGRWHMMTRRKRLLFYLSRAPGEVALRR